MPTFAAVIEKRLRTAGAIAQLVEQRTENPCVPGSIPGGTTFKRLIIKQLLIKVAAFFMSFRVFLGGFSMIFQLSCKPRCKPKKGMATTVNVLCYKSKTLGNGEHPLMICVCMDGKRKYKSLGVSFCKIGCH